MIIYLYGPDSYRRNQKVQFYISEFRKKHAESFSINHIDLAAENGLVDLENFSKDQSLFGQGFKLAIINGAAEIELKTLKPIIQLGLTEKSVTLIFSEEKKLKKNLQTFLENNAFSKEEFELLGGADFRKFLKIESQRRNLAILDNDQALLSRVYSGDSWGLVNQLDKLKLGGAIETNTAAPELFPMIFVLTDAGPLPKKLSALAWLLEREEPAKIFNIASTTRNLQAKKRLARYDVLVKSGKLDYPEALLDLVLK